MWFPAKAKRCKVVHGICGNRRISLELTANESLVLLTNETYEYAHTIMEVCTESTTILKCKRKKPAGKSGADLPTAQQQKPDLSQKGSTCQDPRRQVLQVAKTLGERWHRQVH